jgi:hypothetical protein
MDRLSWKNKRFALYGLKSEEEFESIVSSRYTEVFWEDWIDTQALYFNVKKRIASISREICVPDGILLWLEKDLKDCQILIVEYELSWHKDEHILNQVRRFKNAVDNVNSRKIIIDAIIAEIERNPAYQKRWKEQLPSLSFYKGCSDLFDQDMGVILVIDDLNDRIRNLLKDILSYKWIEVIYLLEVRIYAPVNNPIHRTIGSGKEVMALYPDPDPDVFDWYRATISSVIKKGKKYRVKWYDGDNSNRVVSRVSPIGDLLIRTRWIKDF